MNFELHSDYKPTGDQPRAIKELVDGFKTPAGAVEGLAAFNPKGGPLSGIWKTGVVMNAEKERKGPAEDVLQAYTAHMKDILSKNGLLK